MRKGKKLERRKLGFLLVTLVPAFVFYIIFTLYPNLMSAYYSLLEWNGIADPKFIGLKNFITLLTDDFVWRGLLHNLLIMIVTVPITILLALLLAFALTNTRFRENKFYQALFYMPNIMPILVVALLWSFIYDGDMGLLNGLLHLVTDNFSGKYWLADKSTALICIMIPMIWCNVGFHMIIYINAITAIPDSLYEVATLEGATMRQKMWHVTVPLIRETLITSATFLILNAFGNFEIVMLMTNGGPGGATNTLSLYMYHLAFGGKNEGITSHMYGYSSAVGIVLTILLIIIRFLMEKFSSREAVQY